MMHILRPQSVRRLRRELDRAVALDATLAPARAVLLQPLEMLESLAAQSKGALANDTEAQERLRLLLSIASASALKLHRSAPPPGDGPEVTPCEPGLVDTGALVIVALAAGRIGKRTGAGAAFVDTVLGTAMLAAPAEALSRALASGLDTPQVVAVLGGLFSAPPAALLAATIEPMLLDACEAARWRCLQRLFQSVRTQVLETEWEGAMVSTIESVEARYDDPPRLIVTLGKPGITIVEPITEPSQWLAVFKKNQGKLVFASPGRPPIQVTAKAEDAAIVAEIPAHAHAGWLGLSTKKLLDATRQGRDQVKEYWSGRNAESPCLRDTPVPVDEIAGGETELFAPPRIPSATWGLRIVELTLDQGGDERLRAGVDVRVTAIISPANADGQGELGIGTTEIAMESTGGTLTADIPAAFVADREPVTVRVFAKGSARIDDERSETLTIAVAQNSGTTPTTPAPLPGGGAPASPPATGAGGGPPGGRVAAGRIVLLRPVFRDRDEQLVRAGAAAQRQLAERHVVAPLPWIADDDLSFVGTPDDPDGPAVAAVIERIENLAVRTVGYEDAVWVVLVPPTRHGRGLQRIVATEAALAIAVVSEDASEWPITVPKDLRVQLPLPRLRVIGRATGDDVVLTEPARVEYRAAGPGGEFITELAGATSDRSGRELSSRRVRTWNPSRSGQFVAHIPVADEAAALQFRLQPELLAVELRAQPAFVDVDLRGDGELARGDRLSARASVTLPRRTRGRPLPGFTRPTAPPEFVSSKPSPALELVTDAATGSESYRVTWVARHPQGIRPRVEIELGQSGDVSAEQGEFAWTRVALAEGASGTAEVAVDRLAGGIAPQSAWVDRIRVVVSDGWNTIYAEGVLTREQGDQPSTAVSPARKVATSFLAKPLLIRRSARLRFWADVGSDTPVRWRVYNEDGRGDVLAVLPAAAGWWLDVDPIWAGKVLEAELVGDDYQPVRDRVRIPGEPP